MACNHNTRGWRAPADTRDDGDDGWRCVDCGLVLCTENIQGDLRSPNGKRSRLRPEFCDRVATLVADWESTDGKMRKWYACGIHRRRLRWSKDPRPFVNVANDATRSQDGQGRVASGRGYFRS